MNDGHAPLKIVRACSTRWLSIESAVSRIIDQWLELKLHFQLDRSNEKCFTAEVLYDMYCNEPNLAFFLFLRPALADVQRVNKLFESNNVDQTKLPENFKVFEKINMLSPTNVLKQVKDIISTLCEVLGYESKLIETIDFQWRKINVLLWNETTNVVQFWAEVKNYTDACGELP
ncbi:unnamed protein product [Macrosiphum euphorbiae]|uniref:Uncharacterized protein n=1 Tax=Macrosiphum euphorbiae TaxID=13131 RepID=A0AAV0Y856_9HEMI|nr:unnamed protein product [Macrosiphum euphorbiae]